MNCRFFAPFVFTFIICVGGTAQLLAGNDQEAIMEDRLVLTSSEGCLKMAHWTQLRGLVKTFLQSDAYNDDSRNQLMHFLYAHELALTISDSDLTVRVIPIASAKTDGKSVWVIDFVSE